MGRMRRNLIICFCLGVACVGAEAQFVSPEAGRLKRLLKDDEVKKLYAPLQQEADAAMEEEPNPIDTIRTEGLLQGDPRKTATQEALRDMRKMYSLAVAWGVTGRKQYLDKTTVYLIAWADSNVGRGDPIDDTNLDQAIEAYDFVKRRLVFGENKRITRWLRQVADAEIHANYTRPERATSHNNWHSHRLKIVGEIGFAIGDTALQGYAVRGIREQIGRNLLADGSSEDFVSRDALHYHVYDLEPLLRLAMVIHRATGADYYHYNAPSGASLAKSVDWLLPYLDGRKTHAEFVHSTVEFDRRRAQNGEAGYAAGTLFEPRSGIPVLLLAAYFDADKLGLARQLMGSSDRYPAWQTVINALGR